MSKKKRERKGEKEVNKGESKDGRRDRGEGNGGG